MLLSFGAREYRKVSCHATLCRSHCQFAGCDAPPCVTFRLVLILYGALDSHPFFPSHVVLGRCFLLAAAASAPAGVLSTFAEPSGWCAGAVLDVAECAVCALAAPSSWCLGVVLAVAGVV